MGDFRDVAEKLEATAAFASPGWRETFSQALSRWKTLRSDMNVEEVFVLYDLVSRMEDTAVRIKGPSPQWVHDMHGRQFTESTFDRERLRYLIVKTIIETSATASTAAYERFAKDLSEAIVRGEATPVIVTTNWDTLLESAIRKVLPDWEMRFVACEDSPAHDADRQSNGLLILKLHGSVDWWLCRSCHTLTRANAQTSIRRWEGQLGHDCPKCAKKSLMPAIVPPVSQKFGYDPHLLRMLADIWWEARNHLNTCNELYVMGYSFPPTDVEFRVFVQQALSLNLSLEHIRVLTNPKKDKATQDSFEAAFQRVLDRPLSRLVRAVSPLSLPALLRPEFSYKGFDGTLGGPYR